ncbi:MAG: DUF3313 family protein [Planctomycetes bacterium]|nr:DUF3313 family protein [Planctomycetota bacterium]
MKRLATLLAIAMPITACGSLWPHERMRGRSDVGFLSSYGNLVADYTRPDVLVWHLPNTDFGEYTAALVQEPVLRRRPDDSLPSPADRDALCLSLQTAVKAALRKRLTIVEDLDADTLKAHRVLRVKLAVTTALQDRGNTPPDGECQRWGMGPGHFALECEVVDGENVRPIAKMVAWDRVRVIDSNQPTPWELIAQDFAAWSDDVAWLVQPPAGAGAAAPASGEGAAGDDKVPEPGPVST